MNKKYAVTLFVGDNDRVVTSNLDWEVACRMKEAYAVYGKVAVITDEADNIAHTVERF